MDEESNEKIERREEKKNIAPKWRNTYVKNSQIVLMHCLINI